ncbi:hypothetical protein [Phaeodactylibacter xiamenensis]|uniref:hypothetical protein n=1 Tax=Phaeodactylibacter xiamenensis TaxID=1524460 RepID=UPI003CCBE8C4
MTLYYLVGFCVLNLNCSIMNLARILFAISFCCTIIIGFGQDGIKIELELPEEVGYLENLHLKYSFSYTGVEPISINNPVYNWELFIKDETSSDEYLIFTGNNYKTSDEGANTGISKYSNGYIYSDVFEADLLGVFNKTGLDICPQNDRFTLEPGNYILKLVYYPSEDESEAIIRQEELIVIDYKESKEKEAAAWLERLPHPLFLTKRQLSACRFCDYEAILLAESFIKRFPNSRFVAYAHWLIAFNTGAIYRKLRIAIDKTNKDKIKYHSEQAIKKAKGFSRELMVTKVSIL